MSAERNAAAAALAGTSISRDGITTVALVVFCQIVHLLTIAAIPLLLPLIREDLQISFTQAGLLSVAATLSYALMQIPAGYLADRFGPGRLFFLGLFGWSSLCARLRLVHAYWLALLVQLVAGAFRALLFAPGLALLASWFPPERRATAMSLFMLGGFTGTIVLALAGPLLAARYGWRTGVHLLSPRSAWARHSSTRLTRRTSRARSRAQHVALLEVLRLARYPIMWVCSGLQFVRFSVTTAFNFWLPSLLVTDRGLSVQADGPGDGDERRTDGAVEHARRLRVGPPRQSRRS